MDYAMKRAALAPTLRQASFGYAKTPIEIIQSLLANSGSGTGSSTGFGFTASLSGAVSDKQAAAASSSSDRRLKSDIIKIGQHPLGIGWYEYTIFGRREQGVMADEVLQVKPEAVITGSDGYMMVNYGLIGRVE
jgi:hypothetical protein